MRWSKRGAASAVALAVALVGGAASAAILPVSRLSSDPYTNTSSQHRTEVEPDTFSAGNTVVAAFQVGRFYDGGSSNIGWATSTDAGTTWANGFMPGTTTSAGGGYDRVSDPSVAYDAAHGTWMVSSLGLRSTRGAAVLLSRSTDGGLTWRTPVAVASSASTSLDKNWTVCDNTATSPFYGHCYTEWDDNGAGNLIFMSTSIDGGVTWSPPATTANQASGLGGQPVVRPNGTVVVPVDNANESGVLSFRSTDGGATWSAPVTVAAISSHPVAGGLRTGPLISADIDAAGTVYVAWQDCRFRSGCSANDIVTVTSPDGLTWSGVRRVHIDGVASGIDHFLPGLGADHSTAGASAHLGLTYYYYPAANCTAATCQLRVGFTSSADGGATWTRPVKLSGAMSLSWLADTNQGRMVGDYISTSFAGGTAHGAFAVAKPPSGGLFDEAIYAPAQGLAAPAAGATVAPSAPEPAPSPATVPRTGPGPVTAN